MKLVPVPSRRMLSAAYERLQWAGGAGPSADDLVLWAHWGRLDPRLAEILVAFFARSFRSLHPTELWEANRRSPQPQALATLLEFARMLGSDKNERAAFDAWARAVTLNIEKAPPQMFFVSDGSPRPERDRLSIGRSLKAFLRWGYFGASGPFSAKNTGRRLVRTLLPASARRKILAELAHKGRSFTVEDYISACGGHVHRRTAERDLAQSGRLRKIGETRGRRYRKP